MTELKKIFICIVFFAIPFVFNLEENATATATVTSFHSAEELAFFQTMQDTLFAGYNGLFAASGTCKKCHGFDTLQIASVDLAGNDVNVVDDWSATMMANSAKDPFWRAKVSHEVLVFPQHKAKIETSCTSCHAPLGHFAALAAGAEHYTIDSLLTDAFGQDGVSCLACHQQSPENLGQGHSGQLNFDTAKVAFGPYVNPLVTPMALETGYTPVHSPHISDAGLCAGCHTLVNETINDDGTLSGNYFVEQATYHEWLNSFYASGELEQSCQDCHLKALEKGSFLIAAGFKTAPRNPFFLHQMAGGNVTMLKLMQENTEALGLAATPEQFDEIIDATYDLLQNKTVTLSLAATERTTDSVHFALQIKNKTGHKFPSGYPARRAFVEFAVTNLAGDTIFHSGKTDADFALTELDENFEPHYQHITDESQVQVYETVIGDTNSNVTTVLERGHHALKDNRLAPLGFRTNHPVYDTTQIAGLALDDPDFNIANGVEGSGSDSLFYSIFTGENPEALTATARIWYQPTPPRWMAEMFEESTPEIEVFREMFAAADRTPVLVKASTIEVEALNSNSVEVLDEIAFINIKMHPGQLEINTAAAGHIRIFDLSGRILTQKNIPEGHYFHNLDSPSGIYIFTFQNQDCFITRKIIFSQK